MAIYESGEDYLETILLLHRKTGFVRSVDIASELNYSKPSISRAVNILKDDGFITVEPGGQILLTQKGEKKAEAVYERHVIIAKFLMAIGVDEKTAFEDSCKIEHDLSEKTFACMKEHFLSLEK